MQPTLAWLDFNAAERERTQRVLALFEERESRDELGLGAIRDSLSDHLFPGTSTIQTRLRYLFFIPWIYQELERKRTPSREVAARARKMELELTRPLLEAHGSEAGVFGRLAKEKLKRLPSSVYWAALRQYDICRYTGGRDDYHRDFEVLWRRRQRNREKGEIGETPSDAVWHPKLPEAPEDFPERPTFTLRREEAVFFRHCLEARCRESLLTHLACHHRPVEISFPWEHPDSANFSAAHQKLLENARWFSEVMHGAAILYNWMLAEMLPLETKINAYAAMFEGWMSEMRLVKGSIQNWDMARFWQITRHPNHTITTYAREFVERWISLLLTEGNDLGRSDHARTLIRKREESLKRARSRFTNRRALEKWGGAAGLGRISFRWATADQFLRDLQEGLQEA